MTVAIGAAAALFLLSFDAQAITLINRDAKQQRVVISDPSGVSTQSYVIESDQTLVDICDEGCTASLDGGPEETFEGDEVVYIQDSHFTIAE